MSITLGSNIISHIRMDDGTEYDVHVQYFDDFGAPVEFNPTSPMHSLLQQDARVQQKFDTLIRATAQTHARKAGRPLSELKAIHLNQQGALFNDNPTTQTHNIDLLEPEKRAFIGDTEAYTSIKDLWSQTSQLLVKNYYHYQSSKDETSVEIPFNIQTPITSVDATLRRVDPSVAPPAAASPDAGAPLSTDNDDDEDDIAPASHQSPAPAPSEEDEDELESVASLPADHADVDEEDWNGLEDFKADFINLMIDTTTTPRKPTLKVIEPLRINGEAIRIGEEIWGHTDQNDFEAFTAEINECYKSILEKIAAIRIQDKAQVERLKKIIQNAFRDYLIGKLIELYHTTKTRMDQPLRAEAEEMCKLFVRLQNDEEGHVLNNGHQQTLNYLKTQLSKPLTS